MPENMNDNLENVLVTAVVTTYNRFQMAQCAIRSVLVQTYKPLEIIVVEDGSDSGIKAWLKKKELNNVHYIRHEENKGLAVARNTGLMLAKGEYIAYLDDDDEWKPECIEKRIGILKSLSPNYRKHLGVVYCGCEIHIIHERRITYNMPKIQGNIMECIRNQGLSTIPSACLFPRKILQEICGFDENLCSSVDHDIWMKLAVEGCYALVVNEALVITFHTKRKKSMTADTDLRICGVEQYLEKWKSIYKEWYGLDGERRFMRRYRTKVLGRLAGQKLIEGAIGEVWHLVRHVIKQNAYSLFDYALFVALIAFPLIRWIIPDKIVSMMKKSKILK